MKICRIISAYSPYSFGGADIYAEKISKEMVKRGNSSVIITINPGGGKDYEEDQSTKIYRFHPFNVSTVHKIGKSPLLVQGIWTILDTYSYYSYCKIREIIKKEKPDIVHLHTPVDVTLSAFSAVKSLGLPLVLTLHDFLLMCKRVVLLHPNGKICTDQNINPLCKLYRVFSKTIINKDVDLVIAPSKFCLDLYKKNGFFMSTQSEILPNGIELNNIQKEKRTVHLRNKSIFNILYCGGLTKHKGVHDLIKAFRMIKNPNVKLNIVGAGLYRDTLIRMAQGDTRIIFHGKFPNEEMVRFYSEADIVVVPSTCYDVRPNVIPEAYKEGVPVIGTNIGGIPELIKDKHTGFLYEPGETGELMKILEDVINNPEVLDSLSANCLEFVKQYDIGLYLDKLQGIYERAIKITREKSINK